VETPITYYNLSIVLFVVRPHGEYNYNRAEFACKLATYRAAALSLLAQSAYETSLLTYFKSLHEF